ncbi:hypothetical protein GY45DRAFT_1337120 [Cubamyces sp. BRFM 1775]|nr:hypothetical protein GY45DRAFT_1337120 [Cubamyces sp. BRFM 1775]
MNSSRKACSVRAKPCAPPTRPNPTPRDIMYIAGTGQQPDMSIEDADRLKSEIEQQAWWQRLGERQFCLHLKDLELSPNPSREHMLQYFRVPLPNDTDPRFKIDIIANGMVGFQLGADESVDNAAMCLGDHIRGNAIWTQRVYFAQETTKMTPTEKRINTRFGYTLGHLITLLLQKQYRHWFGQMTKLQGGCSLQYLVGANVSPEPGRNPVNWSSLWKYECSQTFIHYPPVTSWMNRATSVIPSRYRHKPFCMEFARRDIRSHSQNSQELLWFELPEI